MSDSATRFHEVIERLSKPDYWISYGRQCIDETDLGPVSNVLLSPLLTMGPVATEFERDLCALTGAKHAVVCSNGTTALHLACMALRVEEHDLGVTSPISFLSSANCVEFCKGRVDFVDIDLATLCLSPEKLEIYCRNNALPKVVIPVDFAGIPANLPVIWQLAKKYGFKVIEDAAHSIGSNYGYEGKQYHCGSCAHSDLAIFSFHPVKTITTGEGGAVLTNDDMLADRLRKMRCLGMERRADLMRKNDGPWYYEMEDLGYNYRITDFQCALGRSQLKKLPMFKARRNEIVRRYNDAFRASGKLILPPEPQDTSVCHHLYPIQFYDGNEKRYAVYQKLWSFKIYSQIHYIPIYWQPYYKDKYNFPTGKCTEAEIYYSRCLSLPLYPLLQDDEVDFIIDTILKNI